MSIRKSDVDIELFEAETFRHVLNALEWTAAGAAEGSIDEQLRSTAGANSGTQGLVKDVALSMGWCEAIRLEPCGPVPGNYVGHLCGGVPPDPPAAAEEPLTVYFQKRRDAIRSSVASERTR